MKKILKLSVILMLFLLGACKTPTTQSQTSAEAIVATATTLVLPPVLSSTLLLEIKMTGGMCTYGGCHIELSFYSDGAYILKEGGALKQQGAMDQTRISLLTDYIASANFNEIKSQPFTGVCPTAYDGQEMTYTFYSSQVVETISSCEFVIDDHDPLFQLIDMLWQETVSNLAE